eukprot:COSAG01_NODE_3250_length_6353_cov_445.752958_5_plen_730_part_00
MGREQAIDQLERAVSHPVVISCACTKRRCVMMVSIASGKRWGWRRSLKSNPYLKEYEALPSLDCVDGYYESGSKCIQCDYDGFMFGWQVMFWVAATIAAGWLIWRIVSSDWHPHIHHQASCIVHYGRGQLESADYAAALHWFKLIDERLQEDAGSVRLDHPESAITRGDEVEVSDDYKNKRFRGAHGTVIAVREQDQRATVSAHGKSGITTIPLENLTLLPNAQQSPNKSTALCFCLGTDWCQSANFAQDIIDLLIARAFDTTYGRLDVAAAADLPVQEKEQLMAGCVFVLCGEDLPQTTGYQWLRDTMLVSSDRAVVVADGLGQCTSEDDMNTTLSGLETFLQECEKAGVQSEETLLRETVGLREVAHAASVVARQSSKQLTNLSKIVSAQLQQCLAVLAVRLQWPEFVTKLRDFVASLVLLDLFAVVPTECAIGGGGDDGVFFTGVVQVALFICVCSGLCGFTGYNQYRWRRYDDAPAGARATHLTNFGWALYTVVSPAAMAAMVASTDSSRTDLSHRYLIPFLVAPILLICLLPAGFALHRMRIAKRKGLLRSRAFEARYGWLCARYRPECFWWEILYLETRYATIAAEQFLSPGVAALVILGLSLAMFFLSAWLSPFEETKEEASSWRTSPNRQAIVAYVSQLVIVVFGLICHMGEAPGVILGFVVCVFVIPALFIPFAMASAVLYLAVRDSSILELPQNKVRTSSTVKLEDEARESDNPVAMAV